MNIKDYENLYKEHGFFWNECLCGFAQSLGGKEVGYKHYKTGNTKTARFCHPIWIRVGRGLSRCQDVVDFVGEDAAPVGDCDNDNVELFLTESGRLVGLTDYQFLEWADGSLGWQASIQNLLDGKAPKIIGEITT